MFDHRVLKFLRNEYFKFKSLLISFYILSHISLVYEINWSKIFLREIEKRKEKNNWQT